MQTANDIKKIARILQVVFVIASVVTGVIVAVACGLASEDLVAVGVIGGVLMIVIGSFIAWALKTLITGFGELVENTAVIRENTAPEKKTEAQKTAAPEAQTAPAKAPAAQPEQPKQPEVSGPVRPVAFGESSVKCPRCGAVQNKGRTKCWDCGVPFLAEEDE